MKNNKKIPNIVTPPPGPEAIKWVKRDEETMAPYNRPFYYPLIISKEMMDSGIEILESTIREVNEEYRKL